MLKKIWKLWEDELIRSGFILFIMINLFNFLNYFFHFVMARILSVENYGILMVLISVTYVFNVPSEAISTTFSMYTTKFANNKGRIKDLILRGIKKAVYFSFIIYLVFIPIALFLSYFLKIRFTLLVLTGFLLFSFFINPVLRGVLQGNKRFKSLGLSLNLEATLKIILGVLLVYLINDVYGAISGIILSAAFGFLVSLYFIKDIIIEKRKNAKVEGIYSYSWSSFMLFLIIMSMLSIDTILAKRFFPLDIVGKYAVASIIGKMIFFGTTGIAKAMFPISSEKKIKKDRIIVLKKALVLTVISIATALVIFTIIPELFVRILFGSKYAEISGLLVYTGLAFSFLSLSNLNIMYKLSKGEVKKSEWMFIFVIIEILMLALLNQSLFRFVIALCLSNLLMLIGSLFLKNRE
ncbi:MAG: oligosaccharide flippase family protein [Candidatus Pacearchaeota archaeon]